MNIDVICYSCKTQFMTGFDSLVNNTASCLSCKRDYNIFKCVDGKSVHVSETCPTCFAPLEIGSFCRCVRHCAECVNDHKSHVCTIHEKRVPGDDVHKRSGCTCEAT